MANPTNKQMLETMLELLKQLAANQVAQATAVPAAPPVAPAVTRVADSVGQVKALPMLPEIPKGINSAALDGLLLKATKWADEKQERGNVYVVAMKSNRGYSLRFFRGQSTAPSTAIGVIAKIT